MHPYTLRYAGLTPEQALQRWKTHPFYQENIVLGIDIGLRGIGICVRKGPDVVYAKSWTVDLPAAKALADRRAKRAWRHCRANRKVRLARLQRLFADHGLPWFEDQDAATLMDDDEVGIRVLGPYGDVVPEQVVVIELLLQALG